MLYLFLVLFVATVTLRATQLLDIEPLDTTLMLIAKEGLACFEMADAIPQLATLTGLYLDIFLITF